MLQRVAKMLVGCLITSPELIEVVTLADQWSTMR